MAITKTVIVADDTAFVRDRFTTALEEAGHIAVAVRNGRELLTKMQAGLGRIDLIVLDLRLPHANGVAIVRAIRALDDRRVPILIFSGTIAGADEVRQLAPLGVAGYINEYCAVPRILPALTPHLFPGSFDRRGSPRVLLGIPIACRMGHTVTAAITLNLGKGGVGVRTMSPLEIGAKVRASFHLPGAAREMNAESRVLWSDRRIGMGLQFEKLEAVDQAAIDEFVDQHFGRQGK